MEDLPHEIEFVFAPDGSTSFKVKGVKGGGCKDVAKAVVKATGFDVESDTPTSEFYEVATSAVQPTVKAGR